MNKYKLVLVLCLLMTISSLIFDYGVSFAVSKYDPHFFYEMETNRGFAETAVKGNWFNGVQGIMLFGEPIVYFILVILNLKIINQKENYGKWFFFVFYLSILCLAYKSFMHFLGGMSWLWISL